MPSDAASFFFMSDGISMEMLLVLLFVGELSVKMLLARLFVCVGGLDVVLLATLVVLTSVLILLARDLVWLGGVREYCVLSTLLARVFCETGGDRVA